MRVLVHPAASDITLEGLLYALADPVRLRIFAELCHCKTSQTCSVFLEIDGVPVPKSTLSQHFRILREHGLIRSEKRGVEMRSVTRRGEIDARFPGLIEAILTARRRDCV